MPKNRANFSNTTVLLLKYKHNSVIAQTRLVGRRSVGGRSLVGGRSGFGPGFRGAPERGGASDRPPTDRPALSIL